VKIECRNLDLELDKLTTSSTLSINPIDITSSRIILKNEEGRVLIEILLTVGVVGGAILQRRRYANGAALFPVMAAVGAIGAMVAHLTIVLEKQLAVNSINFASSGDSPPIPGHN
jgi:hypothetical protein